MGTTLPIHGGVVLPGGAASGIGAAGAVTCATDIQRRAARVQIPGWVGARHRRRVLLHAPLGENDLRRAAPQDVHLFEADVAARGAEAASRAQL